MLIGALGVEQARLISLCGAGGKTTLMFALAREFVAQGERVLLTTTTKIARDESQGWLSLAAASPAQLLRDADRLLARTSPGRAGAVIAYSDLSADRNKLIGFAPELVDALAQSGRFDRILVEADGSARKPLKAPAAHEPVIPSLTHALIIVAGLNGLGQPLSESSVFRAGIWSELSGLALGAPVSAESLARCVLSPQGLARGRPVTAHTMLFLNQADTSERRAQAKHVAWLLARAPQNAVSRVVIGSLLPHPDVACVEIPVGPAHRDSDRATQPTKRRDQ